MKTYNDLNQMIKFADQLKENAKRELRDKTRNVMVCEDLPNKVMNVPFLTREELDFIHEHISEMEEGDLIGFSMNFLMDKKEICIDISGGMEFVFRIIWRKGILILTCFEGIRHIRGNNDKTND